MTTIREVAKLARVSSATVSHVVNNSRFVTIETRSRVLEAVKELDYHPNTVARSLRSGKTYTIGLILPDSANPFFAEINHDIEDAAYQQDYSVILCNTERDPERERFYVEVLSNRQVDGIIFVATGNQIDSLNFLVNQNVPVVMIDRDLPNIEVCAVLTDHRQGGYLATRHLLELGHRRIGCIAGPTSITPSAERITGYRKALEEYDLACDESLILQGDYHPESGRVNTLKMIEMASPPTAIFALNDLMALGALRAAAEAGLAVPDDLAVIGYDDIELSSFTNPPLSTIAQPKKEIGVQAVSLLMEQIIHKRLFKRRLLLSPRLIVRQSTLPGTV